MRLGFANIISVVALVHAFGCETPDQSTVIDRDAPSEPETTVSFPFTDVTTEVGLGAFRHDNGAEGEWWLPDPLSGGAAFIDFDADGDDDIFLVAGGPVVSDESTGEIVVYENKDATFTRREIPGLQNLPGYGFGVYPADLDNDGDQDILYTTLGRNVLLRNQGSAFERWNESVFDAVARWSTAAAFFDADNDGWLDILIGSYVDWSPDLDVYCSTDGTNKGYCTPELYTGQPGVFYRNTGGGVFEEATESAGFGGLTGKTLGIAVTDINLDLLPDLIIANDTDPDQLFIGVGGGRFSESGVSSGLAFDERGRARAGMGIDAAVIDSTGEVTVFVANFADEMVGVYRHLGRGAFLDRAAVSKIGRASLLTLAFGLFVADLNLDGNADVFVSNGHIDARIRSVRNNVFYKQRPHLFAGDGLGSFQDVLAESSESSPFEPVVGRAAMYSDYDQDGDVDILMLENNGPVHLYRNESKGHSVRVQVTGRQSNRDGYGARIEMWAGGNSQVRWVKSGSSYLSASEKTVTFGLGNAESADSIHVFWPSGKTDRLGRTSVGSYTMDEGINVLTPISK